MSLRASLSEAYLGSKVVTVHQDQPDELLLSKDARPHDGLDLFVTAAPDNRQARLLARLDNLGKGASGAAVQNLNLMGGTGRDRRPAPFGRCLKIGRRLPKI